jgi:hypothetical protein
MPHVVGCHSQSNAALSSAGPTAATGRAIDETPSAPTGQVLSYQSLLTAYYLQERRPAGRAAGVQTGQEDRVYGV